MSQTAESDFVALTKWVEDICDRSSSILTQLQVKLGNDNSFQPSASPVWCKEGSVDENGDGIGHSESADLIVTGPVQNYKFHGLVREVTPSETETDAFYQCGVRHGYYRTFLLRQNLKAFGKFVNGQPVGIHWLRKEGGSFLVGQITNDGSVHGDVIYLYPNLRDAVSGFFEAGKLIRGQYAHVKGVAWEDGILLPLVRMTINCQETRYDPSTGLRISRTPLEGEPYEKSAVYVKESNIPGAGEGLFARRKLAAGELVALFNGIKVFKSSRFSVIKANSEDWSDYRLTLDRSIDLDIPEDCLTLDKYCATVGHKACHSFHNRNAIFDDFYHPRFGVIMSIVAVRDINEDEEILVNYNYDLECAPDWYKAAYEDFIKNLPTSP